MKTSSQKVQMLVVGEVNYDFCFQGNQTESCNEFFISIHNLNFFSFPLLFEKPNEVLKGRCRRTGNSDLSGGDGGGRERGGLGFFWSVFLLRLCLLQAKQTENNVCLGVRWKIVSETHPKNSYCQTRC